MFEKLRYVKYALIEKGDIVCFCRCRFGKFKKEEKNCPCTSVHGQFMLFKIGLEIIIEQAGAVLCSDSIAVGNGIIYVFTGEYIIGAF